jgi:hypothetical protein
MGTFEPHCCLSHFCEHNGPQVEFIVQAAPAAHRTPTASVLDAVQYRTFHGQLVFEGSRHIHSAWTAFLRGTCIRCLSVEFLGGEAKTMCFGDHSQGYTSFYLFKIPDAQARGCSRQLCLSLTCPAPEAMLADFALLEQQLIAIATAIKGRAEAAFHREHRHEEAALTPAMTINSFRTQRSARRLRDFPVLLETRDFYALLHRPLSWLLWRCTTSKIYAPPPALEPIPTAGAVTVPPPPPPLLGPLGGDTESDLSSFKALSSIWGGNLSEDFARRAFSRELVTSPSVPSSRGLADHWGVLSPGSGSPLDGLCPSLPPMSPLPQQLCTLGDFTALLLLYFEGQRDRLLQLWRPVIWHMITGGRVVVCSAAVSVADAVVKLLVSLLPPAYQPLVLYHVEDIPPLGACPLMSLADGPGGQSALRAAGLCNGGPPPPNQRHSLVLRLGVDDSEDGPVLKEVVAHQYGPPVEPRTTLGDLVERVCLGRHPPAVERALLVLHLSQWHALSHMYLQCLGSSPKQSGGSSWLGGRPKDASQEFLTRSRLRRADLPVLQFLATAPPPAPAADPHFPDPEYAHRPTSSRPPAATAPTPSLLAT